ncbi:putative diacyglycerol O-acyltransferase Mb3154c [Montipora capricornis]|uniref:putative diacyglycerol O-acyltransferase Mb3154c n=1 Tax=Montipora capricornis TaxID=246305 RepID=UPI0035F17BD6
MTFKMDPDRVNHSTTPSTPKSTLNVCEEFRRSKIIQKESRGFGVSPLREPFQGACLAVVFAFRAVMYLLESAMAFLVFCLVVPILTTVAVLLWFQEFLIRRYLSWTRKCTPLPADDAVWQQDGAKNRHIIHALMIIEGTPDIEKLRQIVCSRLVHGKDEKGDNICPRLTQIIEKHFGYFVWKEDDNFCMRKHVITWGRDLPNSLQELDDTISEICSIPLPEFLSPWQFLVIPIPKENCFGLLLRFHHSIGDGVALTRVFVRNLYDVPPQTPEPKKFSANQRVFMWIKAIIFGPLMVVTKFFTPADSSKIHGQELCGKKAIAWSKNIDLSLVKHIKNVVGTTVNDVMVSCIAGALHDYLQENGEDSKPEDMWASVPVDIRASTKSVKLENEFSVVYLRLPIVAKNAVDRLLATKQRMDAIKASAQSRASALSVQIIMLLPEWFSKPILDFFCSKMSCVLSNVPGPQQTLFLGGQRVIEGIFFVPQRAKIGVGLSIFSYDGRIRIGILSDQYVIPDPRKVVKDFEKNFWQLVKELNLNEN